MIELWFNPSTMQYDVFVNGVHAPTINVKIETMSMEYPKATIVAQVNILSEKPTKK